MQVHLCFLHLECTQWTYRSFSLSPLSLACPVWPSDQAGVYFFSFSLIFLLNSCPHILHRDATALPLHNLRPQTLLWQDLSQVSPPQVLTGAGSAGSPISPTQ